MAKLNSFNCLLMTICLFFGLSATAHEPDQPDNRTDPGDLNQALGDYESHKHLDILCSKKKSRRDPRLRELCGHPGHPSYQDSIDGGRNVFAPGCHLKFNQPACPAGQGRVFPTSGDACLSKTQIGEWTNAKCHTRRDSTLFDCDKECKKKNFLGGQCTTVKNFCGKGLDSAKCVCDQRVEP